MYRYPDNFIKLYEKSFRRYAGLPALSLYGQKGTMSYLRLAANVARTHIYFQNIGLKRGDKVAMYAKDSDVWIEAFMAVITYGATVVPVLPDFTVEDATNIINHSEAKLLLAADSMFEKMNFGKMDKVEVVLSLTKPGVLAAKNPEKVEKCLERLPDEFAKMYPQGFTADDIHYRQVDNNSVIVINYTSGTTGFSKGVMLTGWNLAGNVVFGMRARLHFARSRVLTFLPLAHAYGCAFDMLTPLACGSHVTVLGRTPSPAILLKALAEVKPHLILSVPLVFEKIYRKRIEPQLTTPKMQRLLAVPGLRQLVCRQLRKRLSAALGGCFQEVIIGGAAMSSEVEDFLRMIGFPFTVGYGMTECGPLISYTPPREFKLTSVGRTLPEIMESRIDSEDPEHVPGEILVKGQNVMAGYYRNQEATEAVLEKDGWFHTGDVGTRDSDGTLYIRGRCKSMILSASGQNIYPEELEARLNDMPFVAESLVVERDGKLIALIYPDAEALESRKIGAEKVPALMDKIRSKVNSRLAPYERMAGVEIMKEEFVKTPKRSIKRFLYK
ncbi:MAG: AMP-binding protein [Muribaculaceae bacterium]|nr:AMP-binding protein [Muribaculaceae bacterium]